MGRRRMPFGLTWLEFTGLATALVILHATLQFSAVLHRDSVAWRVMEAGRIEDARLAALPVPTVSEVPQAESRSFSKGLLVVLLVVFTGATAWAIIKIVRSFWV